jgi:hypothetical protein
MRKKGASDGRSRSPVACDIGGSLPDSQPAVVPLGSRERGRTLPITRASLRCRRCAAWSPNHSSPFVAHDTPNAMTAIDSPTTIGVGPPRICSTLNTHDSTIRQMQAHMIKPHHRYILLRIVLPNPRSLFSDNNPGRNLYGTPLADFVNTDEEMYAIIRKNAVAAARWQYPITVFQPERVSGGMTAGVVGSKAISAAEMPA